jgi:hypothetical protein
MHYKLFLLSTESDLPGGCVTFRQGSFKLLPSNMLTISKFCGSSYFKPILICESFVFPSFWQHDGSIVLHIETLESLGFGKIFGKNKIKE